VLYGMHFGFEGFVLISIILQHLLSVQICPLEGSWLDFVACHSACEAFLILLIACCGFCCTKLTCAFSLSDSVMAASQGQAYARTVFAALWQPLGSTPLELLCIRSWLYYTRACQSIPIQIVDSRCLFFLLMVLSNVNCCRLLLTVHLLSTLISRIFPFQLKYTLLVFKHSVVHACHNMTCRVKLSETFKIDSTVRIHVVLKKCPAIQATLSIISKFCTWCGWVLY